VNEHVQLVFNGYLNLSDADKAAFIQAINDYNTATFSRKSVIIQESHTRMARLGPMGEPCDCCGK
jgi:hypothetical protein